MKKNEYLKSENKKPEFVGFWSWSRKSYPWLLTLIGVIIALVFGAITADAATSALQGTFECDGNSYNYYLTNQMDMYVGETYKLSYTFSNDVYLIPFKESDNDFYVYMYSYDSFTLTRTDINFTYDCNSQESNGKTLYWYMFSLGTYSSIPVANQLTSSESVGTIATAFKNYMLSDEFEGIFVMPDDIESAGSYSEYIPTPQITVSSTGYEFEFNNATDEYYFELQGRWYSVDDIELYKDGVIWKYAYSTLIKSDLSTWVFPSELLSASYKYDFYELGKENFDNFLLDYPVSDRTYYGGTNYLGNKFTGYESALNTLQNLLVTGGSIYNGAEVYIRYFTISDDGSINYGKWCHWYDSLANPSGSSGTIVDDSENMYSESQSEVGLTPEQKEDLENTGYSKSDTDAITNYINNSPDTVATQQIWDIMESMIDAMGSFPELVSTVFGWLPSWLINMIAVSLACMIILRFLGR